MLIRVQYRFHCVAVTIYSEQCDNTLTCEFPNLVYLRNKNIINKTLSENSLNFLSSIPFPSLREDSAFLHFLHFLFLFLTYTFFSFQFFFFLLNKIQFYLLKF